MGIHIKTKRSKFRGKAVRVLNLKLITPFLTPCNFPVFRFLPKKQKSLRYVFVEDSLKSIFPSFEGKKYNF